MGDNSAIEWLQALPGIKGASWNVSRGCTEVDEGCTDCYAKNWAMMPSMSGDSSKPYYGLVTRDNAGNVKWTGQVRFAQEKLNEPLRWKAPRLIFTNSMSDWLHSGFAWNEIRQSIDVMTHADWHVFMTLTRRTLRLSQVTRMAELPAGLERHIWAGVTVPSAKYKFRIDSLRETQAKTRWISFEPLLGDIGEVNLSGIHWAVIGGLSGRGALQPMHSAWVRNLIQQCERQDVAVFFKQWGRTCPVEHLPREYDLNREAETIIVDRDGNTGQAARKDRSPEMHILFGNKKKAGRIWHGETLDHYPARHHFPDKMLAYIQTLSTQ